MKGTIVFGDTAMLLILSTVSTGLILGAIFALVASGVTIIYGSIGLPNASNGQVFLLAGLACWVFSAELKMDPWLAAGLVLLVCLPLSYLLELVLIRRFYDVPDRNIVYFVVTLGLGQVLWGILSVTIGRWSDQFTVPAIIKGLTFFGPFPIANSRLFVLIAALGLWAILFVTLRYHRYGRALRAVFQNRDAAALRGVDVRRVYLASFVLGNFVVVAGGVLYALAYSFDLSIAWTMAVVVFAIMIIGGAGSVLGALVMGMVFGFTQAIVSILANATLANFAYLGLMLVILLIKPSGIFTR